METPNQPQIVPSAEAKGVAEGVAQGAATGATEASADGASGSAAIHYQVARARQEFKDEASSLTRLAAALAPLAKDKTYADLAKVAAAIDKVAKKIATIPGAGQRGGEILERVREALADRRRSMRENLARELKAACDARGLELRVVCKEEPVEVRIPPFAIVIDRDKGQAEIRFARLPIEICGADAGEIVVAHERARAHMAAGLDAGRLFEACYKAWRAACGAGDAGASDRVEIVDFLPYLAMQMQKTAFRVEPSERNYRGYGRARFAYDVLRLRRAGGLTRGGWRLNLGVATGTTASKKNRVIWFEDEHGDGEFKLTVFFTRQEQG